MILKALCDYYDRCGDLAPAGMEYKEITFLIVIDKEGHFKRIERRGDGKNGQKFLVLKGVRSGTKPKPYIFWDNVEYVLNYTKTHKEIENETDDAAIKKMELSIAKSQSKNKALIAKYEEIVSKFPSEADLKAVCLFYENGELENVKKDILWAEIEKKPTVNVSFLLEGSTKIVAENPLLRSLVDTCETQDDGNDKHVCLITGEHGETVASTTPTSIAGGQATGRLVAFQVNSGYDSYGKEKGYNAPISKQAEAAYTTALNRLLAKDSRNKFMLGGRTFVFWASNNNEASQKAEEATFDLFGFALSKADDPNAGIKQVREVFKAIYSGTLKTTLDDKFYILGLAPNAARIAVVYWAETPLRDFAEKIEQHFADMEIACKPDTKNTYMGIHAMLSTITLAGKESDATPNLPEAIAKSIFQGLPYPYTLFSSCIRRIRAEQGDVRLGRAAIIKAYLNRLPNDDNNKKINVMLDTENNNQGYLCGRLFAVLDKVQEEANSIHTIRERYMNAASATPAAVFATILNLSTHHAEKLSEGRRINIEQLKQEIISKISADGFPAHLDMQDQGRFFVGYYHQRQDLFTKKEDKEETTKEQ